MTKCLGMNNDLMLAIYCGNTVITLDYTLAEFIKANHGEIGILERDDETPDKGINEFMLSGSWNDIQRTWLTHYQITTEEQTNLAIGTLATLSGGAYGVVLHSMAREAEQLSHYLEYLHSVDPTAAHSKTVTEIIEEEMLPTETISEQILTDETSLR